MTSPLTPAPQIYTERTDDVQLEPTQEEIEEFAKRIGINVISEPELIYLAREGLYAPLPPGWKPCREKTRDRDVWFYFNSKTNKTQWEHPMDAVYRERVIQARSELAMNKIQSFDPSIMRPPKSLPPLKRSGTSLAPINPAANSLGRLSGFGTPTGNPRQVTPRSLSNPFSNPTSNNNNPLGRLQSNDSTNIISNSSLNSLKDTDDDEDDSVRFMRPPKKSGLTLTGGGANFLKGSDGFTKSKGGLTSSVSMEYSDGTHDSDAGGAGDSEKRPIKSILVNPNSRPRPTNPTDNVYELDGFSMNPEEMTDEEKVVISQLESSATSKSKGNVKFNLDENTELKFEMSGDENDDYSQNLDERNKGDTEEDSETNETNISAGEPVAPSRNEASSIPHYPEAEIAAMKKAMRDEMETELQIFQEQLEEERKSRQEQIQKHLEATVEQFKLEKEETIRRIKKDIESEQTFEVDKAKREIESLLHRELEEMKTNFDNALQTRQRELEEEHQNKFAAMKKAMRDEMETELQIFQEQLEEERKSRQEQIQKHLEATVEQFKLEKEETIRRIKKDIESEQTFEVDKAKREIESLLHRELEEMKTNFDNALQTRQRELEEEHQNKIDAMTSEFRKNEEAKISTALKQQAFDDVLKEVELELKKQNESLREGHRRQLNQMKDYHTTIIKKIKKSTFASGKSARVKVSTPSPPTNNDTSSDIPHPPNQISRSVSVVPKDLAGQYGELASEDTHQRIVEDAKAFIRMQKNRLKDPSPIQNSSHLILPTTKNNLLLFDEKLLKSVSPRRPASIHSDLVSETESSGVSSLKDHRSSESKKLSRDIDDICNSLISLDQQMKLMWSVVKDKQQQPYYQQDESAFLNSNSTSDFTALLPNTMPIILGKSTRVCASLPTSARKPLVPPASILTPANALSSGGMQIPPRNYSSLLSSNQNSSSQTVLDALRMSGLSTTRLDCTDLLKSLEEELKDFRSTKQRLFDIQEAFSSDDKKAASPRHKNNSNSNILAKTKDLQEWIKKY